MTDATAAAKAHRLADRVEVSMDGGVAEVRLDRPDKLNAIDLPMIEALIAAGERLSQASGLRAVVLHGAGRAFCAGLDTAAFAAMAAGRREGLPSDILARTHGAANSFQAAAFVWRELAVPVVAAIQGVAFGGGFQIALGADMRYASPEARLAIREIEWGLVPDMGGIALMRTLARDDVIRELAFTGRAFSGAEALACGFVTALHADPLAAARATAHEIAAKNPDAVRALKRLLNDAADADAKAILLAESKEQAALIGSPNQIEAIRAAVAKRPARFSVS